MKLFKDIYHWAKKLGKKEFQPKVETTTIEPQPEVKRKHSAVTLVSKSGTRYRLINHEANKKANSPAYTQKIVLS